jgi:hypothetical protein
MSWLSSLFSGNKKTNYGSIYAEPPKLRIDDADVWLRQLDDLIANWDDIKTGKSMFDAVKFIYEPQKTEMQQLYGINAPGYNTGSTGDLFARSGSIPRVMGQMNKTGTLDAGTAGLVTGQLESQMNQDLAGLFGQAKQTQRADYLNSLEQLRSLYPERFQVRNINNVNDYNNAVNSYNVGVQRNAATEADRLQRLASTNGFIGNLGGMAIGSLFGMPQLGGQIGSSLANTGISSFDGNVNNPLASQGGGMNAFDIASAYGNSRTVNPNNPATYQTSNSYLSGSASPSLTYNSTGAGMFNPLGSTGSSVPTSGNPAMANPVNKRSGGMDFSKLFQSLMAGSTTDQSWA